MSIVCTVQKFVKHFESSILSCLYKNVRFVLKHGPFCPETWSILSGSVFVHRPFCLRTIVSPVKVHGIKRCVTFYKQHNVVK